MKQNEMDLGRKKPRKRRKICKKILVENPERKSYLARITV
jgi:hypothetical protein